MGEKAWKEVGPNPPWLLVSGTGVGYYAADEKALLAIGKEAKVKPSDMKQLVGRGTPTNSGYLPQHRGQYQLLSKLFWLERVDDPKEQIYVKGDAKNHCTLFASERPDTQHFLGEEVRFNSFLNGNLQSSGSKRDVYARRGVEFKWHMMESPPPGGG